MKNFIIFKRDLQRSLHKNFSLENGQRIASIWSLKGILEGRGRISGVSIGRISGVRSGRISGVRSGRISGVGSGRISGVGGDRISLTISVSIVESLMLMGMAVDSIVPRFRTGFSISLTISFSFAFHNMHSTTGVGIIPEFEIKISLPYRHTYESQDSIKGNIHTCCNYMVA